MQAVRQARESMDRLNQIRAAHAEPPLRFGIGLHRGDITYGNIEPSKRLDFPVIGAAVNEVYRIEGLCRALGWPVLMSPAFGAGCSRPANPARRDGPAGNLHPAGIRRNLTSPSPV